VPAVRGFTHAVLAQGTTPRNPPPETGSAGTPPAGRPRPPVWPGPPGTATCGIQALTTFDDQNPKMFGYTGQVALAGYDNMTGIGTPAGASFISGLRAAG
jgi:hypothetical protein